MAKTTPTTPQDAGRTRRFPGRQRPAAPGGGNARGSGADSVARPSTPSPLTFFQESRAELRKVTWPNRQDVTNLTMAVIGMTVGIAAFLGLMDELLNLVIKPIIGSQ